MNPTSGQLAAAASTKIPLCVDLDKTLIQTDSLDEAVISLIFQNPLKILLLPFWLFKGKAYFKTQLSHHVNLDPKLLPYNMEVISYIQNAHDRKIILVTGAHHKFADVIAAHLGLFNQVIATDETVNLTGKNKRDFLVKKFGEGQFDYIGDSHKDLPVWEKARQGILVNPSPSVRKKAKSKGNIESELNNKKSIFRTLVSALRCHQWVKNTLLFAPLLLAHKINDITPFINALYGFFAFSFVASSIYIVNDLADLHSDRTHPDKKFRAFASGNLSVRIGIFLVPILLLLGYLFTNQLSNQFAGIILGYIVISSLYT